LPSNKTTCSVLEFMMMLFHKYKKLLLLCVLSAAVTLNSTFAYRRCDTAVNTCDPLSLYLLPGYGNFCSLLHVISNREGKSTEPEHSNGGLCGVRYFHCILITSSDNVLFSVNVIDWKIGYEFSTLHSLGCLLII
jgi:hypothetical protein